ncbi:hypothetical protein WJX82_005848 [Trebouxia sp. C0006]
MSTKANIIHDAFADQEERPRDHILVADLRSLNGQNIYRVTLTVKADTMSDLPTLANQSEGPQLFTCPICLEECPRQEIFVPSGCSHEFCRECARGVVLSAVRNLEFPIDCPVCKLNTPESDDEEEAPEAAQHQLQTLTPSDRTCSDVISAQLGSDAIDPRHAMQLHASHSTPSLETALMPHDSELPPNNLAGNPSHGPVGNDRSSQTAVRLPPDELSQRSVSLGGVLTAPRGVTRGLSSPADWLTAAAADSRSSSLASPPLSRGGSRGGPQGLHVRRGSLDADVHMLLTHEEEEEYLSKSLKAAAHRYGSLVQCPKPDCEGVASLQEGDPHFECPQCCYEWCRECQRDWHPGKRCQDVSGDKCVSRYIPKKPKKKKGHRRGTKSCLSMGSMGDLIKGSLKKFGTVDLTADSDASLNRYLKRNRVLECPQCKNGITKMDGGCNHIMCAVCKTHICWLCGVKICQGINNYWDANRHFWIKGTPCYGQIQAVVASWRGDFSMGL